MTRRTKIFLSLSAVLLVSDLTFVAINYMSASAAMRETLRGEGETLKAGFDLSLRLTHDTMLTLASFISRDPNIQKLFLAGQRAVEEEGGGAGGPKAAAIRKILLAQVKPSWNHLQDRFGIRQLQFHIAPGSLSFLRVHQPERFGDRMDDLRFIIVDTNTERTERTGFETGRIYSGLRGVVPFFATDPQTGEEIHVGALEVGTSFDNMLSVLSGQFGAGVAVLLKKEHVQDAVWDQYIAQHLLHDRSDCECYVEATSDDEIYTLLREQDLSDYAGSFTNRLVRSRGRHLSLTRFPLVDYLGTKDPARGSVGSVLIWTDAGATVRDFHRTQWINVIYAVIGFVLLESLLFAAIRLITARLEAKVADRTRSLNEAQDALKRQAVALKNANESLQAFVYTASHDLQEPLRTIASFLALLERRHGHLLESEAREFVSFSVDAAKRMSRLLSDLLAFSRIETRHDELAPVSGAEVLNEARDNLEAAVSASGATILLPTAAPQIVGDRRQLVSLFQNLIGNAIKYRAPDRAPEITVTAEGDGPWHFVVRDNGTGIPADQLERVFGLFQRLHHQDDDRGTGIGLALVKRVVDRHDGEVWVESVEGEGSAFHVVLPATPAGRAAGDD